MADKTTSYANAFLKLVFNGTNWASIADNTASSPATVLYASLHTSSPGVGGSQNTNEAAYPSYARVSTARTTGGFTVTTNSVSPVANIVFPAATGSPSETETYIGFGLSSSGAGTLLYFAPLNTSFPVTSAGAQPIIVSQSTLTET